MKKQFGPCCQEPMVHNKEALKRPLSLKSQELNVKFSHQPQSSFSSKGKNLTFCKTDQDIACLKIPQMSSPFPFLELLIETFVLNTES